METTMKMVVSWCRCGLLAILMPIFISAAAAASEDIWVVTVQDTINPMVAEYIDEVVSEAENKSARCVIIELDTPGGLIDSTRVIVQRIINANVPVITYVSPSGARAASAGMFITIASHVAAMAPATNIGAAHPVTMGPGGPMDPRGDETETMNSEGGESSRDRSDENEPGDEESGAFLTQMSTGLTWTGLSVSDAMEDKILNDTLAWAKTLAENRRRNLDWVIRAVKDSESSTETEALEAGVIDMICATRSDLIERLNGIPIQLVSGEIRLTTEGARIVEKPMTWRQRFLSTLINPTLAIYLLALGGLGLYFELSHPGVIIPGVVGGICLILGLFAMHTLPINTAGLLLILLAFVFFALEIKMTSYGVLTIGGIAAFILGSTMLVDEEVSGMQVSLSAVVPLALALAAIMGVLVALVVRSHGKQVITGNEGLSGARGIVTRALQPEGQIFVHGEIWRARSYDDTDIIENREIIVLKSDGLTLIVKPLIRSGREEEE